MSEYKMNLAGWKAIAVVVVLIAVFGIRLVTFNDKKDDTALMRKIELQLLTEYLPDDAAKLKAVYEAGDMDEVEKVAKSITSTELDVESVQASYPLFNFKTPKDVVVKVKYSLNDATGTREKGTNYYLFKHRSFGNSWEYKYESNVVSYYLNFL